MRTSAPVVGTLDGLEVHVQRLEEYADPPVRLESALSEANPAWRFTDAAGHAHAPETYTDSGGTERVRSWPTLEEVVDETYWCDDCNDEHQRTHLECRLCREAITPGSRPAVPVLIPSPLQIRATLMVLTMGERIPTEESELSVDRRELVVDGRSYRGVIMSTTIRFDGPVIYEFEGAPSGESRA